MLFPLLFFLDVDVMFFDLDVEVFIGSKNISTAAGDRAVLLACILFDDAVFPAADE